MWMQSNGVLKLVYNDWRQKKRIYSDEDSDGPPYLTPLFHRFFGVYPKSYSFGSNIKSYPRWVKQKPACLHPDKDCGHIPSKSLSVHCFSNHPRP